tara:strand:+ start:1786 stop:2247 length:462 start_codon:yes stop_codon:yes gene_type:complete
MAIDAKEVGLVGLAGGAVLGAKAAVNHVLASAGNLTTYFSERLGLGLTDLAEGLGGGMILRSNYNASKANGKLLNKPTAGTLCGTAAIVADDLTKFFTTAPGTGYDLPELAGDLKLDAIIIGATLLGGAYLGMRKHTTTPTPTPTPGPTPTTP